MMMIKQIEIENLRDNRKDLAQPNQETNGLCLKAPLPKIKVNDVVFDRKLLSILNKEDTYRKSYTESCWLN